MKHGPSKHLAARALVPLRGHQHARDHLIALAFLHEIHSLHWPVQAPSGPRWEDLLAEPAPGLGERLDASLAAAASAHPVQLADAFPNVSFAAIDDASLRAACSRLPRLLDLAPDRADALGLIYTTTGDHRDQQTLGQFFTPTSIARLLVRVTLGTEISPGAWILEPAVGAGALLLASIEYTCLQHGPIVARSITYIGIERDADVARLARMNVVLANADESAHIFCGDALTQPVIGRDATTGQLRHVTFDLVLANPPFNDRPARRDRALPPLEVPERLLNRQILLPPRGKPALVPNAT
jgi:type I restriction-modification system DNA methylase subunit